MANIHLHELHWWNTSGEYFWAQRMGPRHGKSRTISPTWNSKQPVLHGCFNWMMNQIFTWEMVGNCQTSIKNWLFRVPGISHGYLWVMKIISKNPKVEHNKYQQGTRTLRVHPSLSLESSNIPPPFKQKMANYVISYFSYLKIMAYVHYVH